jgi:acetyl-CoA acetyltransferase
MTSTDQQTPYIVVGLRSPFSPAHGALSGVHAVDLLAQLLRAVRTRTAPSDPLVFCGVNEPIGAQAGNVASAAMQTADWEFERPAVILSGGELCGHAALNAAVDAVRTGRTDLALATSVASASMVPPGASMRIREYGRAWADGSPPWSPSQACEQKATALSLQRVDLDEWTSRLRDRPQAPSDARWVHKIAGSDADSTLTSDRETTDSVGELPMFEDDGVITASSWAPISDGAAVVAIHNDHDGPAASVLQRVAWKTERPEETVLSALTADIGWSIIDSQCAVIDLDVVATLGLDHDTVNPLGSALLRGRPEGVSNLAAVVDAQRMAVETSTPGLIVCAGVDGSIEAARIEPT